jgi:hypothetical protein
MGGRMRTKKITRIDSLTEAQKARFAEWRDKWIAVGLSTEPADRAKFERAVAECYRFAQLAPPKRVVWVQSPVVMAYAGPIAARLIGDGAVGDAVGGAVRDAVRDAVDGAVGGAVDVAVRGAVRVAVGGAVDGAVGDAVHVAVRDAVDGAVRVAVHGAVRDAVDGAVRGAVRVAVGGAVDGAVGDAVDGAVRDAVDGAVGGAVRDAVDGAVRVAVRGAVRDAVDGAVRVAVHGAVGGNWYRYIGGQFWVGGWWGSPAFVSFFRDVCGLHLDPAIAARAAAYQATCESACWWWPHRDFVIACERPRIISRDDQGRLHSETGNAIEFRDGWGVAAWHGTVVPVEWIRDRKTLDPSIALTDRSVERRRAAAEIIGWARVLQSVPHRVIDEDPDPQVGKLLAVDLPDAPNSRFVFVRCATGRDFALPVPQEMETALAANAWTYGIEPVDLKQLQVRT